jgi:parallel beta-helix repeat protein
MRKLRLVLSWLTLVGLLLSALGSVPALGVGPEYVVNDDGDNTGCPEWGTETKGAFTTISGALGDGSLADGDTILVCPGTYNENVSISNADLTLQSTSGCEAIIQGNITVASGADGVTIDGFGIDAPSGDSVHIWPDDVTVKNNCIVGEGPNGGVDGIVYTHSGSQTVGGTVENNTIEDCELGIVTDHDGVPFTVDDNYLDGCRKAIGPNDGAATITNNTVKNSTQMGIEIFHADTSVAHNNCLSGNAVGVWNGDTVNTFDAEDNYWGCADGPGGSGCDTVSGDVDYDPWLEYCPWEVWYWKPDYPDYAPSGMPDFDQRQDEWGKDPGTGHRWTYCGPVAVANCLWWFDSKFEPNPGPPTDLDDGYPLVESYNPGVWSDHDPRNVMPFVQDLAWRMDTDAQQTAPCTRSGTNVFDMQAAIDGYLVDKSLDRHFYEHTEEMPTFEWVEREVERSEDVILLLGFYEELSPGSGIFERRGGHYVTVAGVNSQEGWIAFSDPIRNNAEFGGAGRVRDGILIPHNHGHGPPPPAEHNDAGNVSHDAYQVMFDSPTPGGSWGIEGYADPDVVMSLLGTNPHPTLPTNPSEPVTGQLFTEVEYAVAISPKPVVWVDPDDGWVEECNPANITIDVRITANEFNGVEFFLDFDPDLLSTVDVSEGSMWSGYDHTVVKQELVAPGTIWFAAYLIEPDTNISVYDEQVATIEFHGDEAGISDLDLKDAIVSDTEGQSIEPVFLEDGTLTVFGHGCVHGIVEVQGRFGPDWDGADVTASGGPGGGYSYNTTVTNADGTWQICDITEGEYDVAVEMALYLDGLKEGVSIVDEGDTDVGQVKVLGGDCNDSDGVQPCGAGQEGINTLDATIVGTAFGSSPPSDPLADINDDNTVNILDASLLGGNWHKCSPVPW